MVPIKEQPEQLAAPSLTANGLKVLEKRYIQREGEESRETPGGRLWAVAYDVARGSAEWGQNRQLVAEFYYHLMAKGDFLPNSPTLMNAGKDNGLQYSACYVLPVGDSMDEIFEAVKRAALVHKSGGGTGFSFSRLRPAGDVVGTTGGIASGPISFMEVFNAATEQVKQGGTRRGANMGILRVDHPDVIEFINCKRKLRGQAKAAFESIADSLNDEQRNALHRTLLESQISNFNISVAITDCFMDALKSDKCYDLVHPVTGNVVGSASARYIWQEICNAAWETGDPGLVFIDRINHSASNPTPTLETIESTNPCGEQALGPNDVCNLGSINLGNFVVDSIINWERLESITRLSTRFMDDVISVNPYPDDLIREKAYANRRLGLGVMGWADMLIKLEIPYDSVEALNYARMVMLRINNWAHDESRELAGEREPFKNFRDSIYAGGQPLRNGTLTTVAPTGTISIIAGCSSGIEPLFALVFDRKGSLDGALDLEVNQAFVDVAKREGFWTEELAKRLYQRGTVRGLDGVPEKWQRVFGTAHDIDPEWHIRMQAAWQEFVDNSISKTINLHHTATVEDVQDAYNLAWETGCKGTTVYRDGSKVGVLHVGNGEEAMEEVIEVGEVGVDFVDHYLNPAILAARASKPQETVSGDVEDAIVGVPSGSSNGATSYVPGVGISNPVQARKVEPNPVTKVPAKLEERPDVLTGRTRRISTPLGTAYITINEDENGEPFEVFVNQGKAGSDIAPLSEAIGKLTSLLLRVPSTMGHTERLREAARKLRGVGGSSSIGFGPDRTRSLPDALAKVLEEYISTQTQEPTGLDTPPNGYQWVESDACGIMLEKLNHDLCPDCGCALAEEEGCAKCYTCGYARC